MFIFSILIELRMRSGVPASPFKAPTADLPVTPQYLAPKGESKNKSKSKNKNKSKNQDHD